MRRPPPLRCHRHLCASSRVGVRLRHRDGGDDLADRRPRPGRASRRRRLLHRRPARRELGPGPPLLPQRARSSRRPTRGHGWQIPMTPARCLPRLPARCSTPTCGRRYGNPYTTLDGRRADAGADRPAAGKASDPARRARPRSRARTSSRCSARTCSRGCSPTRRTAGTRTWSAGSRSASPATRCAAATRTHDYIFTRQAVPVREQAAAAAPKYAKQGARRAQPRRSMTPANAEPKGGM